MDIKPVAYFRSPLTSKFGLPRQSGLAGDLSGRIVLEPEYRREEALRGLEQFDYLWLIWEFSGNPHEQQGLTVRPPRLGGNERVGVFASRSPFRPNRLGLSCVYINSGFVDQTTWEPLQVELPEELAQLFSKEEQAGLRQVLAQDPRPRYHDDPNRVYGMPFAGSDIRFRVSNGVLTVVEIQS